MGLLGRLLGGDLMAGTPAPDDDFWYGDPGVATNSGMRIDAEGAKKISAWYRGRDILATSLAMLPLGMNERLPNDQGRDAAPEHPLHDLIHRKPNGWQDSFQWRRQAMFHIIDHGNHYSRIVGGGRGFVDQLWPLDPKRMTVVQLGSMRLAYVYRENDGQQKTYTQDEIFHLRGASDDGIAGKGILQYARESVGLGVALDSYASRLFKQGSLHGGVIKVPGVLNPEASKRMADSFVTSQNNWHMPKVLEQGADYIPNSTLTPENSQFILSRKFTVNDIARWLGLPPHMLGDLERSTNNNIEWQGQEFVTYNLGLWLSLWEFSINDQLVLNPKRFYAEFVRDALVRGDIAVRFEAYQKAVATGFFTRNEVRVKENLKKLPGLDEPLDPANITGKQPGNPPSGDSSQQKKPAPRPAGNRAEAITVAQAQRLLRTEVSFVQKAAVQHADNMDAFAAAITEFYAGSHLGFVQRTLLMTAEEAQTYCAGQASQILNGEWLDALAKWQTDDYAQGLAALALGEAA
jgi:HK97 family phage portal protein